MDKQTKAKQAESRLREVERQEGGLFPFFCSSQAGSRRSKRLCSKNKIGVIRRADLRRAIRSSDDDPEDGPELAADEGELRVCPSPGEYFETVNHFYFAESQKCHSIH